MAAKTTNPAPQSPKPPRRRLVKDEPHSPWQKLVTARAKELGPISMRKLAEKISTASQKIDHTVLWAWTKNHNGFPPAETYDEKLNIRMAKALQLDPALLAQAYEDSRKHLATLSPQAGGRTIPVSILRRLIADSRKDTWTKKELVSLIDELAAS